jgi:hypothetical protein
LSLTAAVDATGSQHAEEVRAVKNFLAGLLLGTLVTYWYLTDGGSIRTALDEWWERASSPPPSARSRDR